MEYSGKTALVTGASSGIGLAYCQELAARGGNLIMVARRQDLLEQLAKELRSKHKVTVTTIAMDLSSPDAGKKLVTDITGKKLPVDLLINNAGFGTNARLSDEDRGRIRDEINLNVSTLVDLTAAYLPEMLAKNQGAIVNIASTAAYQPVPGMAVYAATKAFVLSFTSAVWGEVKHSNVRVLAVSPGATATEFFDVAGATPSGTPAPSKNVVMTTFKALDAKVSKPSVIDGSRNARMAGITKFLPKKLVIDFAGKLFLPRD